MVLALSRFIPTYCYQAFKLTLQNDGGPGTMYVCAVYIDGTLIDKYLVTPDVDKVVEGIRVEEGKVRPFVFLNVRLTGACERSICLRMPNLTGL